MRAMLWTVILAFAAWSGWWWFASSTAKTATEDAFAEARAQGWAAGHGGIGVAGYPNRVDLNITSPQIASPDGRWGWSAPFVQAFALTYKPWHLIAAFAPNQTLTTPLGPVELRAGQLRSSLVLVPGMDLTLDRAQIVGEAVTFATQFGELTVQDLSLATRQAVASVNGHDIGLDLRGVALPKALQDALPPESFAPGQAQLHIEAEAVFDAPLDRHAAARSPQVTQLSLRDSALSWGAARLAVSGQLTPDAQGRAEGQLTLEITGAAEILRAATQMGVISQEAAQQMQLLTFAARKDQPLSLPLTFANGVMRLGPLTLAEAPRLR